MKQFIIKFLLFLVLGLLTIKAASAQTKNAPKLKGSFINDKVNFAVTDKGGTNARVTGKDLFKEIKDSLGTGSDGGGCIDLDSNLNNYVLFNDSGCVKPLPHLYYQYEIDTFWIDTTEYELYEDKSISSDILMWTFGGLKSSDITNEGALMNFAEIFAFAPIYFNVEYSDEEGQENEIIHDHYNKISPDGYTIETGFYSRQPDYSTDYWYYTRQNGLGLSFAKSTENYNYQNYDKTFQIQGEDNGGGYADKHAWLEFKPHFNGSDTLDIIHLSGNADNVGAGFVSNIRGRMAFGGSSEGVDVPPSCAVVSINGTNDTYAGGLLLPRLTPAQAANIDSPEEGLLIYVKDGTPVAPFNTKGLYVYDSLAWRKL